jgi:ribosomal protein S18 acetylase RimI-like enzyme
MVPLNAHAASHVLSWDDGSRRALALHHALLHHRPGLWGDHARRPTSVVLLRRGEGQWEAYGTGAPEPAARWLAARRAPVALLAPDEWDDPLRSVAGAVRRGPIQVRYRTAEEPLPMPPSPIATRRLGAADVSAFAATAPAWALRAWGAPRDCVLEGAAFGVPYQGSFAAMAWIGEVDQFLDAIGVYTAPRFRRLGLGRAAAMALVRHIVMDRRKCPLWATAQDNDASQGLAEALGFSLRMEEPVLRFGSGRLEGDPGP